ncbi:hypothetical protein K4L06_06800 [Lysobacter sp. BMK333-48F3]|uniref:DUF5694 domain-containing protein n=1 Tax=Lysobacter sp. BMK333-48F3 TaxID=2867962 RepID=UPI001C8B92ED|nr:DUF5694 domain-containing protein [Lysobacter sp. BMK333-48F3]MBX9401017.1 hypothetical protein [Lysobacter sp. BMK333-48F3]
MPSLRSLLFACCLASCAAPALAQADLDALSRATAGPRTQVAVLGSIHLSALPKDFDLQPLQPLLDRLAAFDPQVIAVEAVSGEGCDHLRRHRTLFDGADDTYCPDTEAARRATGLEVPAAIAEMRRRYAAWPARPTPAQRRGLAAVLLAAGERASALTQWLQLPAAERRAGDGLDAALAAQLEKLAGTARNENFTVGAALAARLGLQRVYAVDDHSADRLFADMGPGFQAAIGAVRQGSPYPYVEREQAFLDRADLIGLYRFLNGGEAQQGGIASDFGAALRDPSAERYGRQYVAWWEARNLRMAANLREAFGNRPGVRVLNIVGASHKPYLDAYLGRMHDVDVVDVGALLAPETR